MHANVIFWATFYFLVFQELIDFVACYFYGKTVCHFFFLQWSPNAPHFLTWSTVISFWKSVPGNSFSFKSILQMFYHQEYKIQKRWKHFAIQLTKNKHCRKLTCCCSGCILQEVSLNFNSSRSLLCKRVRNQSAFLKSCRSCHRE